MSFVVPSSALSTAVDLLVQHETRLAADHRAERYDLQAERELLSVTREAIKECQTVLDKARTDGRHGRRHRRQHS